MRIARLCITAIAAFSVLGAAEKPDFSGTWRPDSGAGDSVSPLKIVQKDGEIQISGAAGKNDTIDVTCNTMGKECEGKMGGEAVKFSYHYYGPTLVKMAFVGKNERVTKTRRTLSEDGAKMLVEVIPMMPAGKSPEKHVFVRDQRNAAVTASSEASKQ